MRTTVLLMSCALGAMVLSTRGAQAATASAAGENAAGTTIGELVVTAERRQENIQDTPIAVSAFSAATLKNERLDGGENLVLHVPNTYYSRTNFGGYNFKIRGIGTDVITFAGTAGVSINYNELPVTANHFQDADFFDVERVEVLRGPQGTLYGRNATGGAVDVITQKPTDTFGGFASAEYGNYNTVKVTGAVNIPLGPAFALRLAGDRLVQDGFGVNSITNRRVDGRDLGAFRATLSFRPSDRFSGYLAYEHFGEDDNRNRIGKQLCIKDPGPSSVGGQAIAPAGGPLASNYAAFLNQGCIPGSLYQPAAYGTLNSNGTLAGVLTNLIGLGNGKDVFRNHPLQNSNLHDIESVIQPLYTAQEDLFDLRLEYKLTDNLTLQSITGYNREVDSNAADYNRIVPLKPYHPVTTALLGPFAPILFPGGVVADPQTGTSNKLNTFDYGNGQSKEYTEEVRLLSSYNGPLNFAVGAFYSEQTSIAVQNNYYVESSALTAFTIANNVTGGAFLGGPVHIGANYPPDGTGHNYYDARDGGGYLKSYAGFGEIYYSVLPNVKLTLGGRYTVDQLLDIKYPIELLVATPNGSPPFPDGVGGFPTTVCTTSTTTCLVPQKVTFREFTGRANLDWTPVVSFTDKTLIYLSYSRGYKGGGFNTPCQAALGVSGGVGGVCGYPLAFAPEFIDAYELGTKNTLFGGSLTLNLTGFYYNYSGYQISRIVSESSVNENINAKIYGAEFEGVWEPIHDLLVNLNVGYLHSKIDGGTSIDSLNLTQGDPNLVLVKDTAGANCVAPAAAVAGYIAAAAPAEGLSSMCYPSGGPGVTSLRDGVPVDLTGKHLPNTPAWTVSVGAQYTAELTNDWAATLRGDFYWQDSSFARIYNAVNDVIRPYHFANATLTFVDDKMGVDLQLFVKNIFNAQPITGTYVTDPTSGLFQNVFTLDPRTYGVMLTKRF
ncbi:MAG: TonB-dependent receptor [Caulobacteraceae bacterium]